MGALNVLKYEELGQLLDTHFCLSTDFKTVSSYGLQAVTTSETSRELIRLYVECFRPKGLTSSADNLFVSIDGKTIRVGRYVTSFFKRVSYLNLCTTTIRSMVATETSVLTTSGQLTPEQTKSSISMGGHSSITCEKFYQKRSRELDVLRSQEVHQKLIRSPQGRIEEEDHAIIALESSSGGELSQVLPGAKESFSITSNVADIGIVKRALIDVTTASNIGIAHPCYQFEGRRITWTNIEVHHVGTWCKAYQEEFPSAQNVVAKCLDSILKDSKVRENFHPHHLMDSTRLRWGWKKFLEEEIS